MLLTDSEISEMRAMGDQANIEVNLFLGPRARFDIGAQAVSAAGKALSLSMRGADQILQGLMDVRRAVRLGIRSVLVSDLGMLQVISRLRGVGELPEDLIIKTSVMMAPANPVSARLLEDLGAAGIRGVLTVPIDFYVEAPDNIGGFVRYYEIPELIRVAAPIYLKFGLRNSPDVYPSGTHLENTVIALSRERVRRAQIAMEMIRANAPDAVMSPVG